MELFDDKYQKKDLFGEEVPKPMKYILNFINSGSVLDIGCGYGRNSIFFAKNGFKVFGIDSSKVGIEKLDLEVKNNNYDIETKVSDFLDLDLNETFDLILCWNVLQFVDSKEKRDEFIFKMNKLVNKGGYLLITIPVKPLLEIDFPYLFERDELESYYLKNSWEIISNKKFEGKFAKLNKNLEKSRGNRQVLIVKKL